MSERGDAPQQVTEADLVAIREDLGRDARGVAGVGARCVCGRPLVVVTSPRLPNGSPFPTTFYLSSPPLTLACSRLESAGYMAELATRLAEDPDLAAAYARAHQDYLRRRSHVGEETGLGEVPEIAGISAGGMPNRVKCLHALVGHSLAAGPGVNPIGDLALAEIHRRGWWEPAHCSCRSPREGASNE